MTHAIREKALELAIKAHPETSDLDYLMEEAKRIERYLDDDGTGQPTAITADGAAFDEP